MQIFSEIYGAYFRTVERILSREQVSDAEIRTIISEEAFRDSLLFLPQKLRPESSESWGLLQRSENGMLSRITKSAPPKFVTLLQKRWLRAKLTDPRMRLFLSDETLRTLNEQLSDVTPLYPDGVFRYFDVFAHGDPYENEHYRSVFRTVLSAVHSGEILEIRFVSGKGKEQHGYFLPLKLEYSRKNDKFRVFCFRMGRSGTAGSGTINIGRITAIRTTGRRTEQSGLFAQWCRNRRCEEPAQVKVSGERNGIERFLMEFASYEKQTEWDAQNGTCMVRLWYDKQDETELLIQLLGFGPVVEILGPPPFRAQAAKRVAAQYALLRNSEHR